LFEESIEGETEAAEEINAKKTVEGAVDEVPASQAVRGAGYD
jgi:hypothetical protein